MRSAICASGAGSPSTRTTSTRRLPTLRGSPAAAEVRTRWGRGTAVDDGNPVQLHRAPPRGCAGVAAPSRGPASDGRRSASLAHGATQVGAALVHGHCHGKQRSAARPRAAPGVGAIGAPRAGQPRLARGRGAHRDAARDRDRRQRRAPRRLARRSAHRLLRAPRGGLRPRRGRRPGRGLRPRDGPDRGLRPAAAWEARQSLGLRLHGARLQGLVRGGSPLGPIPPHRLSAGLSPHQTFVHRRALLREIPTPPERASRSLRAMPRRDQRILLGLAALTVLFAVVQSATGISGDVLLAAPALILLLPLLAGQYVGEDGIARLSAFVARPRRRLAFARPTELLRAPAVLAPGGRLIALALGPRGPPPPALPLPQRPGPPPDRGAPDERAPPLHWRPGPPHDGGARDEREPRRPSRPSFVFRRK